MIWILGGFVIWASLITLAACNTVEVEEQPLSAEGFHRRKEEEER